MKSSLDGICDEGEDGAVLLSAGFDDREQRFHEAATCDTLCPERELSPDDGMAQRTLGCVVGGFDVFVIDECPEVVEMVEQFRAGRFCRGVSAPLPFFQNHVELALQAIDMTLEPRSRQSPVANAVPVVEHFLREFQQRSSHFGGTGCSRGTSKLADGLEVAFEMCPAPLSQREEKVHSCPVATNGALVVESQPVVQDAGPSRQSHPEDREAGGHKRPQPGLVRLLFCRRLVDIDVGLPRQGVDQLVKARSQRRGSQVLHVDDMTHAARLVEQHGEKGRRAAFAQTKVGHQQRGQGDRIPTAQWGHRRAIRRTSTRHNRRTSVAAVDIR